MATNIHQPSSPYSMLVGGPWADVNIFSFRFLIYTLYCLWNLKSTNWYTSTYMLFYLLVYALIFTL